MEAQLSEGVWIDRFVMELARLGATIEPELVVDMAREVWPFLGELPPEAVARADWDQVLQNFAD
ncbi:MAG: hypothetical protein V4569_08305 [Pseudomonadota bacterium]